jgi:hypothetical protein
MTLDPNTVLLALPRPKNPHQGKCGGDKARMLAHLIRFHASSVLDAAGGRLLPGDANKDP